MKKRGVRTILVGVAMLSLVTLASAQALPGTGWWTAVTIQNAATTGSNTVSLEVNPLSGGTGTTKSSVTPINLAKPGDNVLFVPIDPAPAGAVSVPMDFTQGSMVVSASAPVVAVGQVTNFGGAFPGKLGVDGGFASAMYRGSTANASTLIFPIAKSNYAGKTNSFYIQAADADVTFNATIKTADNKTHIKGGSIVMHRSVILSPGDFSPAIPTTGCGFDPSKSPCFGSLTVVATGNIVGAEVEYVTGQSPATLAQSTSLYGSSEGSDTLFCPVFKNAYGPTQRITGLAVANAATSGPAVTATVTWKKTDPKSPGAATYTANQSIPAGGSAVFAPQQPLTVQNMPTNYFAAATITAPAGSKLVAVVNEANFPAAGSIIPQKATTYSCFSATSATSKISLPLVKEAYPNSPNGSTTGLTVQNVDTTATTVTATYNCKDTGGNPVSGSPFTVHSTVLQSGQAFNFFDLSGNKFGVKTAGGPPAGSFCGVTVDGAGKKIIAVAQESSDFALPQAGRLDTKNYEGFNQ